MRDVSTRKTKPPKGRGRQACRRTAHARDERERCPEWPRELADILSKTLSKSPAQKCQTGLEIAADLRKSIAALSTSSDAQMVSQGVPASSRHSLENAVLATVVTRVPVSLPEPETASFDIRL